MHLLFLFIGILWFSEASAAHSLTRSNLECACDPAKLDPLEEPQSFNFGNFQGLCVDSCRFRAVRVLNNNSNGRVIGIGNVLHFGEFYKGSLSVGDISQLSIGFEEFFPGVFHVFLEFSLKEDAKALRLESQTTKGKVFEVRSLVLSPEGVPPKNHKYKFLESYFENYLLANRVVTGDEMRRWTSELKHPLQMHILKVNASSAQVVLTRALEKSEKLRLQNVYQLFTNNCSTTVLSYLDGSERTADSSFAGLEEALPIVGPFGTFSALVKRNLLNSSNYGVFSFLGFR